MARPEFIKLLILRTVGNFLVLFMIFGFLATFGPALYAEANYRIEKSKGITYVAPQIQGPTEFGKLLDRYKNNSTTVGNPVNLLSEVLAGSKEKVLIPPNTDFSIVVPKIGAAEAIVENTDPSNETEYLQVLSRAIAHAKGTSFPGMGQTTYLFAHSADNFWNVGRYNAVFYLLKELAPGDEVYVYFQNKRFTYVVYDSKIIDANDIEYIDSKSDIGERLILQTCWPPGTAWKRQLVFARPRS